MLLLGLYYLLLGCLSIYGLHRAVLLYFYFTGCGQFDLRALGNPNQKNSCIPRITVQLPVFNERFVVSKAIDSLSRLRYPRDRFEIQVLDDSTDETTNIAQAAVRSWRSKGISIQYRHRASRTGFKAGALAEGLREATGDLVAVFDADFLPEPNFLERVVWVFDNPCIGMVQARWDHSNRDHSLLTRLQALFLDGHFVLEHGGRFRGGCFFNFNGTAGVWRRAAIDSAGGWHTDTLTEDLDLSYRAQLAGWQFVFLPDVAVPAELPIDMTAFKSQQHRWAKGSIQTCLKVLPTILRSSLPLRTKTEACFHLTANFNYLLLVPFCVLLVPVLVMRFQSDIATDLVFIDFFLLCAAMLSVANFYLVSQRELSPNWWRRSLDIPALIALSLGLSVNNAMAVIEGLTGRTGDFVRTPKYGSSVVGGVRSGYARPASWLVWVEMCFALYFTGALVFAIVVGLYLAVPVLALFQFGFIYASIASLAQQSTQTRVMPSTSSAHSFVADEGK
tara:strand:+ start:5465 stop:6976 length:1512 start_codon:yes stop_codon:yes gene_type:complete